MAGLGEACSHIAALLFAVEVHNRLKDTCTTQPCKWLSPTMQNVPYAPISDISFTAHATKRKKVLEGKSGKPSQPEFVLPLPPSEEILFKSCPIQQNLLFSLFCLSIMKVHI